MIGRTISNYRVIEHLGSGGMAEVYKAMHIELGRPAALKFLRPGTRGPGSTAERLLREAQTASRLDHPNICTIYEIGKTRDGQRFIIMAYYEGETLAARLERGVMPLDEALDVARQVARGLDAAHRHGIEHRDVKPANLILTAEGTVRILDFGIARLAEDEARDPIFGTLPYVAPERLEGHQGDTRGDIWSLGVVLYRMLNGQAPFLGDDPHAMLESIGRGRPAPPLEDPRLEAGYLEQVLDRALARDPDARYLAMRPMLEDLENLAEQIGGAASLSPPPTVQTSSSGFETARLCTIDPERSVAILPFTDRSPARDQAHLCFGIADELVRLLTPLVGLRVASLTSLSGSLASGETGTGLGQHSFDALCRRIGAGSVLEGSVLRSDQRLRVTASLIRVHDRRPLWSQRFDREFEDVFAIQDEIAAEIVVALEITLMGRLPSSRQVKRDLEAYNLYLKGRYHWNKRTEIDTEKGIDYFRAVIVRDPEYTRAWAGLADSYAMQGLYGWRSPIEVMPEAGEAARRALAGDGALADALVSRASVRAVYRWDWQGARRDFERALELDPSHATAHQWYAMNALLPSGCTDAAQRHLSRARELDPLSLPIAASSGIFSYYLRRFDEAIEELEKTLEIDRGFVPAHLFLGLTRAALGDVAEAAAAFARADQLAADRPDVLAGLGSVYAAMGAPDKARKTLARLDDMGRERFISPSLRAQVQVALGEPAAALATLGDAVEQRVADLVWLGLNPAFDPLHGERAFHRLLARIGLASAGAAG